MYQTFEQRRRNWERAVCLVAFRGRHSPTKESREEHIMRGLCFACHARVTLEGSHWMAPRPVTLVEWP